MTAVAGYVGAEPEGLRLLAGALDVAELELRYANDRIQALLIEAGEGDVTCGALPNLTSEVNVASGDVRRRAAVADEAAAILDTPVCEVPWYDPLRRAARAVVSNGQRAGEGAVDSAAATGELVWQLAPTQDGWRQSWVDLGTGLVAAAKDPRGTFEAMLDPEALREEGFAYWMGSFAPDALLTLAGGAGAGKVAMSAAKAAKATSSRLAVPGRIKTVGRVLLDGRRRVVERTLPDRPLPDPVVEGFAKERVIETDEFGGGHGAVKHGPETTLEQQRVRVETRAAPDGTKDKKPRDASRFFRWEDQWRAIEQAKAAYEPGGRPWLDITFDHVIGEGYLHESLTYTETSVARVIFNKRGDPVTSYPNLTADS